MKIVIAGGRGYLGSLLVSHFLTDKRNVVYILSRSQEVNRDNIFYLKWDGKNKGYWATFLEGADILINLTGKSVNCRYTDKNKEEIYRSRIDSTDLLCNVIQDLKFPPKVFIQSSSATIYRYSEDKLMTENEGEIGIDFSMDVCKKWETIFNSYNLTKTKKIITRTSIVIGEKGGAFPIMKRMTKFGLGGKQGNGNQFISFITEKDYVKAIDFLIDKEAGIYNLCVPNPIKNKDFQKELRRKCKIPFGANSPKWLLKIGATIIGTEAELLLKSRKVYPEKLLNLGFEFSTKTFKEFKLK
ncbi:TIGR01777 family oxidoreductase [Tenacibaculum ovolyticum]|uniref:TIGR01777 family oxidoreductase n=1 Tax=Tenacibaculum ovolyticum TaxID=104270 RepID=UPI0022F3E7F7|nr:TIGR01777 family oxidoreductase [Tenacibaculum ovolyticum]WBX77362.1 TIGR01777 family oxidoreductase [Tenacibaculum ovolyticum]